MGNFRPRLTRFMSGRYARNDQLYNALFIAVLILLFSGAILGLIGTGTQTAAPAIISWALYLLSVILLGYTIFRFFSRNIRARQRENAAWLRFTAKLKHPFRRRKARPADTDTHVFRSCPACSATLRLPRKPGKHTARCPRCSKTFEVNIR